MTFSRKTTSAIVLTLSLLFFAGCAAIFKGSSEDIELSSDPQGAKVYLNNQYVGITPTYMRLKSDRTYHFEFHKEGYKVRPVYLGSSVGAGWVVLDILLGGLIGIIVDAATGSWFELDQRVVVAALEPGEGASERTSAVERGRSTSNSTKAGVSDASGPNVEVSMRDGTKTSGELLGHGDDWVRLRIYVPSREEFRDLVLQKSDIVSIHDIVNDVDLTADYK